MNILEMDALLQLPLSLQLRDEATFTNFFSGQNRTLVDILQIEKQKEFLVNETCVYIYGSQGTGCTHLLQAACHQAHQFKKRSVYIPMKEFIHQSPSLLEGFELLDLVCIDDIDEAAGSVIWEEAIFHLYNQIKHQGNRLVISAKKSPSFINFGLMDLASRLAWGIVVPIQPLNSNEKTQALQFRAKLRGMNLQEDVAKYIVQHSPKGMKQIFSTLERLDRASLRAKRKPSVSFVKKLMTLS